MINMDFMQLQSQGYATVKNEDVIAVVDECNVVIQIGKNQILVNLKDIQSLESVLKISKRKMLDNWKDLGLDEKSRICKETGISYGAMRVLEQKCRGGSYGC
ncbi:MAG: hypothetical protein PUK21_01415 [Peptostreptococcaceae bacterium]|nr:hypothetical protein [Peptostreptococcaceae bacterium]MDY5738667.1 hypothetical protein [Anaerovoracaceae bacterium]